MSNNNYFMIYYNYLLSSLSLTFIIMINLICSLIRRTKEWRYFTIWSFKKLTFVNNMYSSSEKYRDILTGIRFSARKRPIPYHRPTPTPPSSPSSSESSRHSNWSSASHRSSCSASRSPSYTRWEKCIWIPSGNRRSFFVY